MKYSSPDGRVLNADPAFGHALEALGWKRAEITKKAPEAPEKKRTTRRKATTDDD